MQFRILIILCALLIPLSASSQYSFPACWTPWTSNASGYPGGTQVSHKNGNYQAKWFTATEPGTTGDWALVSKCGDGGIGPDYTGPQRVIAYLPYWVPDFDYTAFDPSAATHIHIAFNLFKQNNNDFNSATFASIAWGEFHNKKVDSILFDLNVLSRAKAKNVKVQVAIGGATDFAFLWLMTRYYDNDAKLEEIANFITNYVNTKGIDGVDLDLECWWPDATISGTTEQGGRVRGDKWGGPDQGPHPAGIGLTRLAQKLRAKMPTKVISAAVFATSYYGNNYDDAIAQHLDWLGLMTYDFTGSWNTSPVGPHASLYKVPLGTYQGQSADNPIYSAEDALEYWMGFAPAAWNHDGGFNVPKAKLAIGVPLYGYDLAARKPNNGNGFVALKWKEILAAYPNAATSFDPLDTRQLGGYIGLDNKKLYYETPKGAAEKIKHTKRFGHQGVIIWELTGDAPLSNANSIMKAINEAAGTVINPAPTVSITSPVNNATFAPGANITINANASDDGSVTRVEFFRGTTKLAEDTSSPYSFLWSSVPAGSYALTAKATDNQGATATSSVVNITVGNASPVASITSPANNSGFSTGSTVTINATASDSDGTVSKVEFYQGATKLGEDLSSPYSLNWASVPAGSYSLTARAIDNLGASGTSSAVNITVGNANPVTSVTAPANNATFTAPATINITANASDSDGTIARVEFYHGSTKLGEDTSSPYSFTWSNVAAATYSLTTRAVDNVGAIGTSAAVSITVSPSGGSCSGVPQYVNGAAYATGAEVQNVSKKFRCAVGGWCSQGGAYEPGVGWAWTDAWTLLGDCTGGNVNPTASITSPSNNAAFAAPASITINATASDTDGTISKVEFYNGTALLGTDTSTPYSFSWTNVAAGSYALTAKATDNGGGTGTSAVINVTVSGNTAPTASITSPANNASFTAPATITINASASDTGGSVSKVEFFQGTTKLGEDISSPYSFSWSNVAAGSYSLTAKATDNTGLTGTSAAVNVTVTGNTAPTASITSPANNASFTAPATITINASASDAGGSVAKVEFFQGTTKLGEDTSSPYSLSWSNVAAGSYSLTAKATDNTGLTGTSSAVNITVTTGGCTDPQYVENGGYVAGSRVKNVGNSYECKPYPYSGWCNGAAWAYAPGTGAHWQDAWILKGTCSSARSRTDNSSPDAENEFEVTDSEGLDLYPNPGKTTGQNITLVFEKTPADVKINLQDVNGVEALKGQYQNLTDKVITVTLPDLPKGLYILRVRTENRSWIKKYMIKE